MMEQNHPVVKEEGECKVSMEVELLDVREDRVKFILKGATPSFANAIRRASMCEIPKLAIDEVNIYENTSTYYDE